MKKPHSIKFSFSTKRASSHATKSQISVIQSTPRCFLPCEQCHPLATPAEYEILKTGRDNIRLGREWGDCKTLHTIAIRLEESPRTRVDERLQSLYACSAASKGKEAASKRKMGVEESPPQNKSCLPKWRKNVATLSALANRIKLLKREGDALASDYIEGIYADYSVQQPREGKNYSKISSLLETDAAAPREVTGGKRKRQRLSSSSSSSAKHASILTELALERASHTIAFKEVSKKAVMGTTAAQTLRSKGQFAK